MNAIPVPATPACAPAAESASATCVLINPRSHTIASGGLAERAAALARGYGVDVIEADRAEAIAAALDRALAQGARCLIVLAGDGTVQAIVDRLASLPPAAPMPALLLLGGGRTNLTAADLGGRDDILKKLASALVRYRHGSDAGSPIRYRHALVVEQSPAPPRHGFFVAAALVDRMIRRIHAYRVGGGRIRNGAPGTIWCLLKSLLPAIRGRGSFASPTLEVVLPGQGRLHGPVRLLVATTLAHENQSIHPYAERGEGELRVSAVADGAVAFWRSLPRLLTGRFSARMTPAQGYLSGRGDSVSITGLDGYTLDGQSFACEPARPVVIRSGPRVAFLRP